MNRSAEADIPPPPDGRDQRFDPRREDLSDVPAGQRVTDGQGRRERGSREPESETLGNQQRSQDPTQDGMGKSAKSGGKGVKTPPKRHLLRTRHDWKRIRQRLQAASLLARNGGAAAAMRKGSHRIARYDKIRRARHEAQTTAPGGSI